MRVRNFRGFFVCSVIAVLLFIAVGCRSDRTQISAHEGTGVASTLQKVVLPNDFSDSVYGGLRRPEAVKRFYAALNYLEAWTRNNTATAPSDSMLYLIRHLQYFGLRPEGYHLSELDRLSAARPEDSARRDVLLSDAFLSIVHDLQYGCSDTIDFHKDSLDVALLKSVMTYGGIEKSFRLSEPDFEQYHLLQNAMVKALDSLKAIHNEIIFTSGWLDSNDTSGKIEKLAINLERWRRERVSVGNRYIIVNIPAFMLYVMSGDSVVFESKIIVGTVDKQTPELSSRIECFVTYPYWRVPRKIAVEEYLPEIQTNLAFLVRNNFEVLDRKGNVLNADSLDWMKFSKDYFPVSLRQREGTENALGILKFVFDNPYGVYLHDTNSKRLFKNSVRAYSHGCIRMERAEELAHYLVMGDLRRKSKYVETFLNQKERHTVTLKQPIPIFVRYYTAHVINNKLRLYQDIYLEDEIIRRDLSGRREERNF